MAAAAYAKDLVQIPQNRVEATQRITEILSFSG
jgi:hypothetical protein